MKVKNIMFFGFAAAILSAGAANAAATATFSPAVSAANEAGRKIVSSKAYVDSVASNIAGQLKSVAVTGSYNDLDDKPTIPDVTALTQASHTHAEGDHISLDEDDGVITIGVETSSALSGDGVATTDIPTVGAVNTGLATKQALQEGNVYKVSKNGSWVDANTAVAGSGYITRTQESDGSATIAIDSTKITSSNLTSATGDDLNDLPTVGAVQGAITGISQDVAAHKQVPAKPSSCTAADPCVLMETDSGYGWFHMATDQSASQTGTQQASASLTANVAESNQ